MSMTYHDKIFMAPITTRKKVKAEPDDRDIGRSPRAAPGWWWAATAIFYVAVALVCFFFLT